MEDVRLLVCTHAHSDHYGQAADVIDASGCELWMHPNHAHMTAAAEDPQEALARRLEVARMSGVPVKPLAEWAEVARKRRYGITRLVEPDRDLVPGVVVETDLGRWTVHETPGHAPSHVCLHQAEQRILISGDHLLGRVSLYFDYGWTPDPIGEFLDSLDTVQRLDARLCLAGHARTFTDVVAHIEANRALVHERLARVREMVHRRARSPPTTSSRCSTASRSRRSTRAGGCPRRSATCATSRSPASSRATAASPSAGLYAPEPGWFVLLGLSSAGRTTLLVRHQQADDPERTARADRSRRPIAANVPSSPSSSARSMPLSSAAVSWSSETPSGRSPSSSASSSSSRPRPSAQAAPSIVASAARWVSSSTGRSRGAHGSATGVGP